MEVWNPYTQRLASVVHQEVWDHRCTSAEVQIEEAENVQVEAGEDAQVEEAENVQVEAGEDAQVEEAEDVQVEAGEDAQVEAGEDLQVQEGEDLGEDLPKPPKEHRHLAQLGVVKKQKDQAIKQARHWKACYQKERSAHIKLQEKCEKLMQEMGEICARNYEDEKQQPGESFSEWEHRKNFPPGVPVPKWPVSDFQTRPVPKGDLPVPKPAGPAYLISTFKSQTLGLSKGNPIGKKVVQKHTKQQDWAKPPPPWN